jgi:hypothetical protein
MFDHLYADLPKALEPQRELAKKYQQKDSHA